MTRSEHAAWWCVLAIALFAWFAGIDSVALFEPDEGRNASVALEMLRHGEWLVPRFNGLPYLDKPALYFDAVAALQALFGAGEGATRLASLCFGLATVALVAAAARRSAGWRAAYAASAALASMPLFLGFARIVILDMALAFFVSAAVLLGLPDPGREDFPPGRRTWRGPLFWLAIAGGVFTKGPVGLLLPLLALFAHALVARDRRWFRRLVDLRGIALFVVLVGGWLWLVERRVPGFLHYALIVESLERATTSSFHRGGPFWYYAPVFLLGVLPWSLVPLGFGRDEWRAARGPAAMTAIILLFFSLSRSKLPGYLLPSLPLCALGLGAAFAAGSTVPRGATKRSRRYLAEVVVGSLGVILLLFLLFAAPLTRWLREPATSAAFYRRLALAAALPLCAGSAVALWARARSHRTVLWMTYALVVPAAALWSQPLLQEFADQNSARHAAALVGKLAGSQARVVCLSCFPTSLPFYLGRPVPVVTETGKELTSTYVARHRDRLASRYPGTLLRPAQYDSLGGAQAFDAIVTRSAAPPDSSFELACRWSRYRLWLRHGFSSGESR